jgi:hypothetical protein
MGYQMDISSLLIGALAGAVLMTAIFVGTQVQSERRKTSLSRTPLSIQTLATGGNHTGMRS